MSSGKLRVCVFVCLGTGGAGSPGKYQTSRAVLVSAYTCVHPRISSQKSLQSNQTQKKSCRATIWLSKPRREFSAKKIYFLVKRQQISHIHTLTNIKFKYLVRQCLFFCGIACIQHISVCVFLNILPAVGIEQKQKRHEDGRGRCAWGGKEGVREGQGGNEGSLCSATWQTSPACVVLPFGKPRPPAPLECSQFRKSRLFS